MTSPSQPEAPSHAPVAAQDVADYLRAHPNFLVQHPQLLSELSIPHETGATVSLVERQVGVLREENARQKKQLLAVLWNRDRPPLSGPFRLLV